MRILKTIGTILLWAFALIGFATASVFVAMQFGLFNVRGSISARNTVFLNAWREAQETPLAATSSLVAPTSTGSNATPATTLSPALEQPCRDANARVCTWDQTPEWEVISAALRKDAPVLERVAAETGVDARTIAAVVVPEQMRFFSSNREVFKRWFEPMKLLGSLSQFSLGVSGIKQETAQRVETYANDPTSPFYPGEGFAERIAYAPDADRDAVLFERLTEEYDHYYAYLYTAIFIQEILMQWERAGFDLRQEPGIIVTLFNLGFDHSVPNPTPAVGGAPITVGNTTYSYGGLGERFYRSDELRDVFRGTSSPE